MFCVTLFFDNISSLKLFLVAIFSVIGTQTDGVPTLRSCPGSPTIKIENKKFCDSFANCPHATDETNCTCRQLLVNVKASRICDGVYGNNIFGL